MNYKLKLHILSRSTEQGFAMIAALGIGLVMFLVGLTMVVRSQGDQTTATAQKSTATAMSAAEIGVSRYQSFINTNREIAIYPDCVATRTMSGNNLVCSDSGTTKSWANASALTFSSCTSLASTIASSNQSISWTNVDSTDPTKGQYRLRSYTYPTPGSTPGTGVLLIEGRANQKGSGATATNDVGTSTTRLKVSIPVLQSKVIPYPFPGMWAKTTVTTGKIAANILAPCNLSKSSTGLTSVNSNGSTSPPPTWEYVNTNFAIPSVPPTPTTNVATITYASLTTKVLPRAIDIANKSSTLGNSNYNSATGEYQYIMTDNITGNLVFTPGEKVAVYLQGNIDMTGGQKAIVHDCTGVANCSATDARVYGISATGTANFSLGGNASVCDILFLAPTYDVDLSGGGQAQGCGGGANTNGIYWVKSWSGGGQGNHIALDQAGTNWSDLSFLNIIFPPQIAPSSTWQRQEVD
ncbi:MAG: hypothetical protein WBB28_18470 [Crinalium sp.]